MDAKKLKKYYLFFIFGLVLFLRLPSLFEPFTYGDEGIYLTIGQALRRGLVLYRDIHDNKPPALYLLAALTESFSYFRLLLLIWSLTTIFLFSKLARTIFAKNQTAVIISTFVFGFLSSLHTFESNIANAENFMLLPTIAAFLLVLKRANKKLSWFLAGILLSLATLFKVPTAFDIFPLLLIASSIWQWGLFLLSFTIPILLTFVYFAWQGALFFYLKAAFFQNIPYLSSWSGSSPWPILTRACLLGLLTIGLIIFRKKVSPMIKVILLWFGFSLFAALLSSRPYPHYLIQILPALALSFGLLTFKKEKLIPLSLTTILVASWIIFRFWYYPNFSYLSNFYQFMLGSKSQEAYFANFDQKAEAIYQTAKFIQLNTLPSEKIFIWGTRPSIYALSRRLPVGRYTASYHIIDFAAYQETIDRLEREKPRFIIITNEENRPFPELGDFVKENYTLAEKIDQFQVMIKLEE